MMSTDYSVPLNDQKVKRDTLAECSSTETKLWANIMSKGLLHSDVRKIHRKACTLYEKNFLKDNEPEELQFLEYSLWKLHYKHIDEYRRRISQSPSYEENKLPMNSKNAAHISSTVDKHIEGFKMFLSEAANFYRSLITKIEAYYDFFGDPLLHEDAYKSSEPIQLHKCQFVCHRLYVCLGDLARYLELYCKHESQQRNWSLAAKYYLASARIYPGGGNPHNQLAVLARYTGDEFLAVYHCIRSLAVKEPFPDALNNLTSLLESNRSTHINSLSHDLQFNFMSPSDRIVTLTVINASHGISNSKSFIREQAYSNYTELWSLIIRMTSFFFLEFSLEQFSCTLASTIGGMEALLALDDAKLCIALESYQSLDVSKDGPYRTLQVVSVLIFITHSLYESVGLKELKTSTDKQQHKLLQLASTVTFICMGRLVERSLRNRLSDPFPLLPAILVFMEWVADTWDAVDVQEVDDKHARAIYYFLDSSVELLNRLQRSCDIGFTNCALWEDYEMLGFSPLSNAHASLVFSSYQESENNFEASNEHRSHRLILAAKKIANRPRYNTVKWMFYDEVRRMFHMKDTKEVFANVKLDEEKSMYYFKTEDLDSENHSSAEEKSVAVDEEENIVFKPMTRHNSAPLYRCLENQRSEECRTDRASSSDESLSRASSMLIAQNRALIDSLSLRSVISSNGYTTPKQQSEAHFKGLASSTLPEAPMSAGPPSLSAWVLSGESVAIAVDRGADVGGNVVQQVEEVASKAFCHLPLDINEDCCIVSRGITASSCPSPPYSVPVPSAPLLPDDSIWFTSVSTGFPDLRTSGTRDSSSFIAASSVGSCSNWPSTAPQDTPINSANQNDHSFPFLGPTFSPPWAYPVKGSHIPLCSINHEMQHHYSPRNFYVRETSSGNALDGWGNQMASSVAACFGNTPPFPPSPGLLQGVYDRRREMVFHDHQRPSLFERDTSMDVRVEQQRLLQYLKDREWNVEQKSQLSGCPYN